MSGYISDLDDTYPDGSIHKVFVLDDDLKDLKAKVKDTFPNITGPVNASHTELNYLDGMNTNVQVAMDNMNARAVDQEALGQVGAANIPMIMVDANVTPNSHRIKGSLTSITGNSFTVQYYNLDTSGLVAAGFYFHLHHIT